MYMLVRPLKEDDLFRGFLDALENLKPVGNLSQDGALAIFRKITANPDHLILVAVVGEYIVGAVTVLFEQKFIRGGAVAAHIEDVVTCRGWEGRGVASTLVSAAVAEAKRRECYKVVLGCERNLSRFYEQFGFETAGDAMRLYL